MLDLIQNSCIRLVTSSNAFNQFTTTAPKILPKPTNHKCAVARKFLKLFNLEIMFQIVLARLC